MQIIGNYKRFWGSQDWSIKIDFIYEQKKGKKITFSSLTVEFKNKNELVNSFEVQDLCSCIQLMSKFSEGFGITSYDRRMANWVADYFNDSGVDIDPKIILRCFGRETEDKIDVKVKKMNIASKTFTDILEYDPDDLLISFEAYYDENKWESTKGIRTLNYPLTSTITQQVDDKGSELEYSSKRITNNYNGLLDITNVLINDKEEHQTNLTIEDFIPNEFLPFTVLASLVAPDKTVLGVFQPLNIVKEEEGLKLTWYIEELKMNHSVQISYVLKQRVPFILNVTSEGKNYFYVRYIDLNSPSKYNFSLLIPALVENNVFSRKFVTSIEALLPIEMETQSILYVFPHYVLKIIDQGHFQKVQFSELFIDALFFDQVRLEGSLLPVLTLYESFLPNSGSRIVKRIYRQHSYSNPLIMFDFDSNSRDTVELEELYPKTISINVLSLGNQTFKEIENQDTPEKFLSFVLNATNNTVKYTLSGTSINNLEKAFSHIRVDGKEDNIEINQHINVESIVDKSNKVFNEIIALKLDPTFNSTKMRLRSFNLKLTEKITELDSQMSDAELDKAFAALQNKESLDNLTSKIKSSYESKFSSENTEPVDSISDKPFIKVSNENEQEIEQNLKAISDEVEQSELSENEMAEIDAFASSHSGENASFESHEENERELAELDAFIANPLGKEPSVSSTENQLNTEVTQEDYEPVAETSAEPVSETTADPLTEVKSPIIEAQEKELRTDEEVVAPQSKRKKKGKKTKNVISTTDQKENLKRNIEIFIIYEDLKKRTSFPSDIYETSSRVSIFNELDESLENEILNPTKCYFKIPKNDRYIILVVNPNEDLTSYIYGRWKEANYPKFKVLLRDKPGIWHLKMQLLESGETYDIKFTTT